MGNIATRVGYLKVVNDDSVNPALVIGVVLAVVIVLVFGAVVAVIILKRKGRILHGKKDIYSQQQLVPRYVTGTQLLQVAVFFIF